MGKYIRHAIGILITAIVGAVLPLLGLTPETLTSEQAQTLHDLSAALETVLYLFLTLVAYPLWEKYSKRFKWLDIEGYAGRQLTKQRAAELEISNKRL